MLLSQGRGTGSNPVRVTIDERKLIMTVEPITPNDVPDEKYGWKVTYVKSVYWAGETGRSYFIFEKRM